MTLACPVDLDAVQLRHEIRSMYSRVAAAPDGEFHFHRGPEYAATALNYDAAELAALPASVTSRFAGIGNPFAADGLRPGATVLDVGSGAGTDLLLAARRVGPGGHATGVEMTAEMRAVARAGARQLGFEHVDVLEGDATALPVDTASIDVVISNGVLNLVPEKDRAISEIARVLRPGGRLQIADITIGTELPESVRRDVDLWTGRIAGALPEAELIAAFATRGFGDVRIVARYDCFAGTSKQGTARKYGVVGVTLVACRT